MPAGKNSPTCLLFLIPVLHDRVITDCGAQEAHLALEVAAALADFKVHAKAPPFQPAEAAIHGMGYQFGYLFAVQHGC